MTHLYVFKSDCQIQIILRRCPDSETDRQTARQPPRQTDRQKEKKTDKKKEITEKGLKDRETSRWTARHPSIQVLSPAKKVGCHGWPP